MKTLQKLIFLILGFFYLSYISNKYPDVLICVLITLTLETQHSQMEVTHGTYEAISHIPFCEWMIFLPSRQPFLKLLMQRITEHSVW